MVAGAMTATTVADATGGNESLTSGAPHRPVTNGEPPARWMRESEDVVAAGATAVAGRAGTGGG